jgi:hypothetical protein
VDKTDDGAKAVADGEHVLDPLHQIVRRNDRGGGRSVRECGQIHRWSGVLNGLAPGRWRVPVMYSL